MHTVIQPCSHAVMHPYSHTNRFAPPSQLRKQLGEVPPPVEPRVRTCSRRSHRQSTKTVAADAATTQCVLTSGRFPLMADAEVLEGDFVPLESFPVVVALPCEFLSTLSSGGSSGGSAEKSVTHLLTKK